MHFDAHFVFARGLADVRLRYEHDTVEGPIRGNDIQVAGGDTTFTCQRLLVCVACHLEPKKTAKYRRMLWHVHGCVFLSGCDLTSNFY